MRFISKSHAYHQTMTKTYVEFQKHRHKTLGGVENTRYPLSIQFDSKKRLKNDKVQLVEKVNHLRIISKPHAYLQTMTKATVKF